MKKTMLKEYLKTIIFAIISSVAISCFLCYLLFFVNPSQDVNGLKKLIQEIEKHVFMEDDEFYVDETALDGLRNYNSWIQIIDGKGEAVYSRFVPKEVPDAFSNMELLNNVQESNGIPGYTLYAMDLSEYPEYGVIIGCDSEIISKYYINIEGSSSVLLLKCILIFLITTIIVIICAVLIYSNKVTEPVTSILRDIECISKGEKIDTNTEKGIFEKVFLQLYKLQDTLRENEKTRAEWIANISHDIRTPLSTVRGYAEVLSSEEYLLEKNEIQEYAKEILKSEEEMEGLVEDLKISQSLLEGKILLHKENVDMLMLIKETISFSETHFKPNKAITIAGKTNTFIFCDRKLMKRSFINIIGNAFIHNDNDVHVDISVEESIDSVVVTIKDTGKGMTQEELEHVFERYYRGTNSSQTQGTGLGLAIARDVIRIHGGEIAVENCEPNGTKFIITLIKAAS